MSCKHTIKPGPCSQCMQATPRRVTQDGDALLLDGQPTGRVLNRENTEISYYARRGGRRRR